MKVLATQLQPGHRVQLPPSKAYQRVTHVTVRAFTVALTVEAGDSYDVHVLRADRGVNVHRNTLDLAQRLKERS